ncbi:hybrid sensor histidine kinase/response regulator transcription factor [Spirosoma radiotolerans]|uniref:histidine kinase n=1 Tax=Spirosoma radiotolerans TaxID=1379870 RepID=A0A0E3V8E9_9BACT|nr:response regulator [Spirosoma radiotolerans]AKD56697.1 histidine kinase [Spirosoma radiotolerans]
MRLLCVVFYLLPFSLFAQPGGWQEITISEGLSQGMIYDLKQDQRGFIWAATKDGLNRYDGYNFTVFTHNTYNKYSLSSNACSTLLVDRHGRLWIGTLNRGLNLYNDRTQQFYHIDMSDPASPDAGNYEISLLAEDPEGNIWVGTSQNKLVKVTLSGTLKSGFPEQPDVTSGVEFSRFSFPLHGGSSGSAPARISFQANGQAVVSAARELYRLNWRQPMPATYSQIKRFGSLATLFKATPDGQQPDYWFGFSADTLIGWQQTKRKAIRLPPTKNSSVYLSSIDHQTIAVATPDFLWLMSPAQLYAQDSLSVRNAFAVMPSNVFAVTKILIDRTGNVWVGTAGYGLRKFNPHVKQFQIYLPNSSLSYLFQDQQAQIYVRNQFDYGRLDRSSNRWKPFLSKSGLTLNDRPAYIIQDHQGFFWVSMANDQADPPVHRLVKFSANWQQLKTYRLPPGIAFGLYGNQTREDKAGHLWIGAANGRLVRFDPITETFQVFSYQDLLLRQTAESETYSLYFDGAGTGWIGTQGGLIRIDHPQATPTFSIYKNDIAKPESLSNDFVSSTIDDPDQPDKYLWVSTKGGGLEQLSKKTGQFRHFTEAQGLPNKVVYGILVDEFKNLWMSTNRGLARFNPRTFKFRNYTKADGLQDDEFNTGSFLKTASGELLFGGINGLTAFQPRNIAATMTKAAPLVQLIGLKINNEAIAVGAPDGILPASIEQTRELDLLHTQNLVTLEFALMDYTNSAKNQYRYRLDGIDQDWVDAGTNRFANYAQLPSGTYTFELESSANGEIWSKSLPLVIRIHPPYYRSWWAYLLYVCILLFMGWLLYKFQKQRWFLQQQVALEQKEAVRLAELDVLKTQFFTNISHEFRTPLTLILGPLTALKQQLQTEKVVTLTAPVVHVMEQNSNRLLSLINQLLDLSKLSASQLGPAPEIGDLSTFFRTLASSFSSLAESRQIQFSFTQPHARVQAKFDHDKIEKIVTNLLSNAFKFTPNGNRVYLRVDYPDPGETGELVITVEDTGIGIAQTDLAHIYERFYRRSSGPVAGEFNRTYEGTGIGLSLVSELVKVLGGTINVNSREGIGTRFKVRLPLTGIEQQTVEENVALSEPPERNMVPSQVLVNTPLPTPSTDNVLLIIDDNADIRAYVRTIFESNYHIIEAENGQSGLDKATTSLPNVIICDLMMPRLDGFEFCRLLKQQEVTSHIPVIMLTAKATVEDRIGGFELGADDYLTKPFNPTELEARVRNLVRQRERLYQRFTREQATSMTDTASAEVGKSGLLAAEQNFMDRLSAVVTQHIDDPEFTVEILAEALNMSRTQLFRKLKALTNTTATNYILDIRMTKAAQLLKGREESVTQVAYAVGFDNPSYFTKVFKERYGVLPSQFGKPPVRSVDSE